uniref:SFRICE_023074 n=1 Tax=Spodoptera frugiperda TaxID=7108 RepID=A0A2H1X0C8_SPOFR
MSRVIEYLVYRPSIDIDVSSYILWIMSVNEQTDRGEIIQCLLPPWARQEGLSDSYRLKTTPFLLLLFEPELRSSTKLEMVDISPSFTNYTIRNEHVAK